MTLEIVGLRIIVDMNLSPSWVGFLLSKGISAVHWRLFALANSCGVGVIFLKRKPDSGGH